MYQPDYFREKNISKAYDFISRYPFGIFIVEKELQVVHVPMVLDESKQFLLCHVSKRNAISQMKDGDLVKAIFHGPHAYIDPTLYEAEKAVPTWNYISVHVTGSIKENKDIGADDAMISLIQRVDPSYMKRLNKLDSKYKEGMMNGVKAFVIEIRNIEMAVKLSQNKSASVRERIINHLSAQNDSNSQEIAREMNKLR